jgi:hypothetical protein
MSSRSWIRATFALVGVLTATAAAQDEARPPVIRGVSRSVTGAALGRPVPMRHLNPPGTFPTGYRGARLMPGESSGEVLTIPTVPPPGAVIATSTKNIPTTLEEPVVVEGDGSFASDRRPLRLVAKEAPAEKPGNWKSNLPSDQPNPSPDVMTEQIYGPAPRLYFSAEYLLWLTKTDHAPPLVTTGTPVVGNPNFIPGALGNADTVILQDGRLNQDTRSGGRFTAGYFLDDCAGKAVEVSGFFLASNSANFNASSAQFPVLTRPFINVINGQEIVQQVAFPGVSAGSVSVRAPSQLWGLEANLICPACCGCDWRVNWLVGPRYLNLTEQLVISEDIQVLANSTDANGVPDGRFLIGDRFRVTDAFATKNQFWGGQVGVEGRYLFGRWTVDGRMKVALGWTSQEVTVSGEQSLLRNGTLTNFTGGLLALPSNIGTYHKANFTVVPEVGMSVGYYATDWMRVSVGYNFLYWSSVVRPGQQVDRVVNPFLIPNFDTTGLVNNGVVRPVMPFKTTDYWAQGITFGVEFNF